MRSNYLEAWFIDFSGLILVIVGACSDQRLGPTESIVSSKTTVIYPCVDGQSKTNIVPAGPPEGVVSKSHSGGGVGGAHTHVSSTTLILK